MVLSIFVKWGTDTCHFRPDISQGLWPGTAGGVAGAPVIRSSDMHDFRLAMCRRQCASILALKRTKQQILCYAQNSHHFTLYSLMISGLTHMRTQRWRIEQKYIRNFDHYIRRPRLSPYARCNQFPQLNYAMWLSPALSSWYFLNAASSLVRICAQLFLTSTSSAAAGISCSWFWKKQRHYQWDRWTARGKPKIRALWDRAQKEHFFNYIGFTFSVQ